MNVSIISDLWWWVGGVKILVFGVKKLKGMIYTFWVLGEVYSFYGLLGNAKKIAGKYSRQYHREGVGYILYSFFVTVDSTARFCCNITKVIKYKN